MSAIPFFRSAFWMLLFSLALTVFAAIAGLEDLDGTPVRTLRAATEVPADSSATGHRDPRPSTDGPMLTGNVFSERGPHFNRQPQWSGEVSATGRRPQSPDAPQSPPAEFRTVSGPPARLMVVDDGELRQIEPELADSNNAAGDRWQQELPFAEVETAPRPETVIAQQPEPAPVDPQQNSSITPELADPPELTFSPPAGMAEAPEVQQNQPTVEEPELADFDPFRVADETEPTAEPIEPQPETVELTGTSPAAATSDASAAERDAFDAVLNSETALFASDAKPSHPGDLPSEVAPVEHAESEPAPASVTATPAAAAPPFPPEAEPMDTLPLDQPEEVEVADKKSSVPAEEIDVPLDPFRMPAEGRPTDTAAQAASEPEQPVTPLTSMLPRESRGTRQPKPAPRRSQPAAEGPWPPIQVVPGPAYGVRQDPRGVPPTAAKNPATSPEAPVYTTAQRPAKPRQAPAQQSLIMPPVDPQEALVKNLQAEIVRLQHQVDRLANVNNDLQQSHEKWVTVQDDQRDQLQELRENVERLQSPTPGPTEVPTIVPTTVPSMLSPDVFTPADTSPEFPADSRHPYDEPVNTLPRQLNAPMTHHMTHPTTQPGMNPAMHQSATASYAGADQVVRPIQPQYVPRAAATCQCSRCRARRNEPPQRRGAFGLTWLKRFRIGN